MLLGAVRRPHIDGELGIDEAAILAAGPKKGEPA
jgi:hypothetical protein